MLVVRNIVDTPDERKRLNPGCEEFDRANGIESEKTESGNGSPVKSTEGKVSK